MHLVGPEVNVMGACFFGSPYVSMGRSAQTAWCMTVNGPDLGDVFTFQINPDDPTQYKSVDGWKKFETEMNTIKVLQHDGGLVERSFPALRTAVGPVVTVKDGTAYVFALPMSNDAGRARQLYEMMKAQTMPEFREALKPLGLVMFNILYADKHGDVFWVSNGRIPKRDPRIDSKQLRPGDQQAAQWQGFHALDELPQVTNPSAGYVVNANSGPQNVTPIGAPNPADFPPYMMSHQANSRLRRLDHLLRSDESLTFEEMQTYATDTTVEVDPQFKDQICALGGQDSVEQDRDSVLGDRDSVLGDRDSVEVGQGSDTELLNQVAKVLQAWDHRTDLDSRGAVLFHYLAADKPLVQAVAKQDSAAVATAVVRVAKQVQQLFGAIDVTWDQFSRIRRGQIELAVAGSGGVGSLAGAALRPTYGEVVDGKRYCSGGSSYGMIVDFSGQTKAISCLPFGVSEDPESPYFANMLPLYVERKFKPAWFLPAEVKEHTASEKTLATD
jgi:acyl-homoserine lactone acylase PvdQ